MKIHALLCVYQEAELLHATLERIHHFVETIQVFDGAYQSFPHTTPYSTDGTLEIAAQFPNVTIHRPRQAYRDQIHKRTTMFQALPAGEWGLILDGDEWVSNPETLVEIDEDFDVGWGWTCSPLYGERYVTPRLFRAIPGLHYHGVHHYIFDGDQRLVCSHQHTTARYRHRDLELQVYNRLRDRTQVRDQKKQTFRTRRSAAERRFSTPLQVYRHDTPADLTPHPHRAPAPKQPEFRLLAKATAKPRYTWIIPFSRPWAAQRWYDHFSNVSLPWDETEALIIVDGNNKQLERTVRSWRDLWGRCGGGARILLNQQPKLGENSRVAHRRDRIAGFWHQFLTEAQGEILIGSEDDTLPDPDAYTRLLDIHQTHQAAFVQGTILGRWSMQLVPHWRLEADDSGTIQRMYTGKWEDQDIVDIDGGGWYCFVCSTDAAREVVIRHTMGSPLGPDVCFVHDLTQRGHRCLGVWSVRCVHFDERRTYVVGKTHADYAEWTRNDRGWKIDVKRTPGPKWKKGEDVEEGPRPLLVQQIDMTPMPDIQIIPPQHDKEAEAPRGLYRTLAYFNLGGSKLTRGRIIEVDHNRARALMSRDLVEPYTPEAKAPKRETKVMAPMEAAIPAPEQPVMPPEEVKETVSVSASSKPIAFSARPKKSSTKRKSRPKKQKN